MNESFYQERMIDMIDIIKIKKWLTETINAYKEDSCDDAITRWHVLDTDNNGNYLAIVCGWTDGFEDNGIRDWNEDGEYRLYMKFAYQPQTSLMQEYDIDWLMPDEEETNEVDARLEYMERMERKQAREAERKQKFTYKFMHKVACMCGIM